MKLGPRVALLAALQELRIIINELRSRTSAASSGTVASEKSDDKADTSKPAPSIAARDRVADDAQTRSGG
ncbi:MAG: hypothetical protein RL701_5553 [Pseudomonadota bacterium]